MSPGVPLRYLGLRTEVQAHDSHLTAFWYHLITASNTGTQARSRQELVISICQKHLGLRPRVLIVIQQQSL